MMPFKIFEPYISDDNVTDINFNGKDLWIDDLKKGRFCIYDFLDESKVMEICLQFSNIVNKHFNLQSPVLEAEYGDLRISLLHPSIANYLSVSIRKTPQYMRLNKKLLLESGYLNEALFRFLKEAVRLEKNIMVSGLPGAGKTELVKFLSQFIDDKSRVISIEDTRELHYDLLYPKRDSVSIKVDEKFNYDMAIKASMRQRPNWLLVSEVRGKEVEDLLKSISTGSHLISTIHARSAYEIPVRMLYMMQGVDKSNEMFLKRLKSSIDVGVHLEKRGLRRFIKEVVLFDEGDPILVYHYQNQPEVEMGVLK